MNYKISQEYKKNFFGVIVALLIGIAGYLYIGIGRADTHSTAAEVELGATAAPATQVNTAEASGGKAIQFRGYPASSPSASTLLDTSFDNLNTATPVSLSDYRKAIGDPADAANSSLINTSLVTAESHGKVMRQTLKANEYGSGKGIVTFPRLTKSVEEASIEYDIRFDSNFDWSLGGKLPGLGGAIAPARPGTATGCTDPNGQVWSGRSMWITKRSYKSVNGQNEWIGYMYNLNKKDTCGDNVRTNRAFTAGKWHTVKQYYKLNTPGVSNGIHRMWLDGELVVDNNNFLYRNTSSLRINYIYWSIFRGGNTADWAGSRTSYIDIDNLRVTGH